MKDLLVKMGKAKFKKMIMKKALLYIGGVSFSGCFVFGLIGLFVLIFFFIILPFSFDNSLASSESDLATLQESINPRVALVQFQIDSMYPKGNDIEINGSLIATTIQLTTLHNQSYDIENIDGDYDEATFKSSTKFPSYSLMLDMGKGMIATKITLSCVENNPTEGEEAHTNKISYIEQLVGIDGYEAKTCQSGFSEKGDRTKEYFVSLDVYEKVYLPIYFTKPETLGLDAKEDAQLIEDYSKDVIDTFQNYRTLVYGDELTPLEGIIYVDSYPLIADDMSLPIGFDIPIYGARMTDVMGPRSHPITGLPDLHTGVDLSCEQKNPPIYAVYTGKIIFAGYRGSYGNRVQLSTDIDGDGVYETITTYNHMSSITVSKGESVIAGSEVGICGTTGSSTGNHLHFEILVDGKFINPEPTLRLIGEKVFNQESE